MIAGPRRRRATTKPTANSAIRRTGSHGHPLGPGTQSSRPCTDDRPRRYAERDRPLRVDRVQRPPGRVARREAATYPSSGCGGRARSRCATPTLDATAAASTRRCPRRLQARGRARARAIEIRRRRTQVLVEARAGRRAGTARRRSRGRRRRTRVRFVSWSLLPSSTTRTVTPECGARSTRARQVVGGPGPEAVCADAGVAARTSDRERERRQSAAIRPAGERLHAARR